MALIIIGFIIFVIGLALARSEEMFRRFAGTARIIGLLVLLLGLLSSCIIQIEAGAGRCKETVR